MFEIHIIFEKEGIQHKSFQRYDRRYLEELHEIEDSVSICELPLKLEQNGWRFRGTYKNIGGNRVEVYLKTN